jgi:hypothetical protein
MAKFWVMSSFESLLQRLVQNLDRLPVRFFLPSSARPESGSRYAGRGSALLMSSNHAHTRREAVHRGGQLRVEHENKMTRLAGCVALTWSRSPYCFLRRMRIPHAYRPRSPGRSTLWQQWAEGAVQGRLRVMVSFPSVSLPIPGGSVSVLVYTRICLCNRIITWSIRKALVFPGPKRHRKGLVPRRLSMLPKGGMQALRWRRPYNHPFCAEGVYNSRRAEMVLNSDHCKLMPGPLPQYAAILSCHCNGQSLDLISSP